MRNKQKTPAPTQSTPGQLNEAQLTQVVGGLLPAVGPAAKPLVPAV